jgi:pilus assembly protein Flp/PilA
MSDIYSLENLVVGIFRGVSARLGPLCEDKSGATAIEYGLIAALIAVAAVSVMGTVGTNLSSTFNTVATAL